MSLGPIIAFLALDDAALPSTEQVLQVLSQHWPEMPAVAEPQQRPGVMTFALDDDLVGIALIPKPLPWKDMAGPCEAAWYWPQAADAFQDHAAHLIATILAGSRDRLQSAVRLTAMVAAAAAASNARGIYWGPGRLVNSPEDFFRESQQIGRTNLPLNLWLDFRIVPGSDATHSLFTTGMAAFGHRELEIWDSGKPPQFLRDCAYNIAHYVLEKGIALKQNETIGLSDDERIPISVEPSRWDSSMMIARLEL